MDAARNEGTCERGACYQPLAPSFPGAPASREDDSLMEAGASRYGFVSHI